MRALRSSCLGLLVCFACGGSGGSGGSAPAAPGNVTATAGAAQITLSWDAVPGATGYLVQRGTAAGGPYAQLGTPAASPFTDTTAAAGTRYYYVVQATNASGPSLNSSEVTAFIALPAPAAPTGLMAAVTSGQIVLSWTAGANDTGYVVSRGATPGGPYTQLATPAATSYTDGSASPGLTYFYVVAATSAGGAKSGNSNEVSAQTAPAAPAGLTAAGASTSITLSWTASPGAASYDVLKDAAGTGTYTQLANVTATTYADTGLPNSASFSYEVRARNAAGVSAASSPVAGATGPAAPSGLSAAGGNAKVSLSWNAAVGSGLTYRILRSATAGGPYSKVADGLASTAGTDAGLMNHTTYYYVVRAVNGSGESDNSNEASATPARELCVVDNQRSVISTFDADQSGDGPPLRKFGWNTGLSGADHVYVEPGSGDVYVNQVDATGTKSIAVYGNTLSGAPRVFADPAWSTNTNYAYPVSVNSVQSELLVLNSDGIHGYTYSTSGTPTLTPTRKITVANRPAGFALGGSTGYMFVVDSQGTIFVYGTGAADSALTGAAVPAATATPNYGVSGLFVQGVAYDAKNDALLVLWGAGGASSVGSITRTKLLANTGTFDRTPISGSNTGLTAGSGLAVSDGISSAIYVTNSATGNAGQPSDSILEFALTDLGNTGPGNVINGPVANLFGTHGLAFDARSGLVWTTNGLGQGLVALDKFWSLGTPPTHNLDGSDSGLFGPTQLRYDGAGRLFVLNQGPRHNVTSFPVTATGSISASTGATLVAGGPTNAATLDGNDQTGLAFDPLHQEVWVANLIGALLTFPGTAGANGADAAPLRSIAGNGTPKGPDLTTIASPRALDYDTLTQQIVVANQVNDDVLFFARDTGGCTPSGTSTGCNIAPARSVTGFGAQSFLNSVLIDPVHAELVVLDNLAVSFFPASASGAVPAAAATFSLPFFAPRLGMDPAAQEVFVPFNGSVSVYSRAGALLRTIQGANTGLVKATDAQVCN